MSPNKTPTKLTFAQGLQLFFVQKILDEHTMSTFFGDELLNSFLLKWSEIVWKGRPKDPDFPCSILVPADFPKGQPKHPSETVTLPIVETEDEQGIKRVQNIATIGEVDYQAGKFRTSFEVSPEKGKEPLDISFVPEKYQDAYRPLLENSTFCGLFHLLLDEDLGQLMRIEYSAEVAELATITAPAPKAETKNADIIRETIARQLEKKPEELTTEDYDKTIELDLRGRKIEDIELISSFKKLEKLYLAGTQVSDLTSIKELKNLQVLRLGGTPVSNIKPIKGLSNLQEISLAATNVKILEPIRELKNLQELYLSDTQVSNIEPIKGLSKLQTLDLSGTNVIDIEPLKGLPNLQRLHLGGTKVSSIEPLKSLSNLQGLSLSVTSVSDIESLKGLSNLLTLNLHGTLVKNLEPIRDLKNLRVLDLSHTPVSDKQVDELKKTLPELRIFR